MKLKDIKGDFNSGSLKKADYIDKMYSCHSLLFDYAKYIPGTNISAIEIQDNKVIMTFRDSGVKFICVENDVRLAPLDTLNFGSYETDELKMQLSLMEDGMNILDIGANLGWYALHVAKAYPSSKIFSFEPVPSTFEFLNENIIINKLDNIRPFNFGFSDKEGSFSFFYDPGLSVNASLVNVAESKNAKEIQCIIKTIDHFVSDNKIKVDFIKCDVEGAEITAFKGGLETIKKYKPVIFTEMLRKWTAKFNYHPNDIIKLFSEIGYECFVISNGQLKVFSTVDESTSETNYIFLHSVQHAQKISKYLTR